MSTILIRVGDVFKLPICTCYMFYICIYINIYIDKETHRLRLNLLKKKNKNYLRRKQIHILINIYICKKEKNEKRNEKMRYDIIV